MFPHNQTPNLSLYVALQCWCLPRQLASPHRHRSASVTATAAGLQPLTPSIPHWHLLCSMTRQSQATSPPLNCLIRSSRRRVYRDSANERGRCWVGQLTSPCVRAQQGLKGMQDDMLGPRGGTGEGSLYITADCLSAQHPYIAAPLVPIEPLDWFSIPAHQGVNGVPWVSGWMEVRPLLTAIAGTPFIPLKEP